MLIRNEDHFTGRDFEAPIFSLEGDGVAATMNVMGIPGSTPPPIHITRDTIEAMARRIVDNSPSAADIASITTCLKHRLHDAFLKQPLQIAACDAFPPSYELDEASTLQHLSNDRRT